MALAIPKTQYERRSSVILVQYWNELRGNKVLPHEEDINSDRLIGVWERCFLVQVRDLNATPDFNYSYFGPDLQAAYEDGRLQRENDHIACPNANRLAARYREVMNEEGPVMEENSYQDNAGRTVKYRQIFLPFGRENGTVEAIMGGAWFRLD